MDNISVSKIIGPLEGPHGKYYRVFTFDGHTATFAHDRLLEPFKSQGFACLNEYLPGEFNLEDILPVDALQRLQWVESKREHADKIPEMKKAQRSDSILTPKQYHDSMKIADTEANLRKDIFRQIASHYKVIATLFEKLG